MTADRKDYQLAYRRLMLVVAAAMLAIPYGIANYKFDGCTQSLQTRLDDMKAKAETSKRAMEQK